MFRASLLFVFALVPAVSLFPADERLERLEARCREQLRNNPQDYAALFNQGYVRYRKGKFKEALQAFHQAYSAAPSDEKRAAVRYNMGNSLFRQKKLREALQQYRLGLELNPDDQDLRYNYTVTRELLEQNRKRKQGGSGKNNKKRKQKQQKDKQQEQQGDKRKQPTGQKQQQPQKGRKQERKRRTMNRKEAMRLLRALHEKEKKLGERKRIIIRGVKKEKDW